MSNDSGGYHTQTTSTRSVGCAQVGGSCLGLMFGCGCLLFGGILLVGCENNAVTSAKSLKEGLGAAVSIESEPIDKANQGKLVHVSGITTTDKALEDKEFGVSILAVHLKRKVEMYQWHEHKKEKRNSDNRTWTVYTYDKQWKSEIVDSSQFNKRVGHNNPKLMPFEQRELTANEVKLGAFTLSDQLVKKIDCSETLTLGEKNIPEQFSGKMKVAGENLYLGESHSNPRIGDVRVEFKMATPAMVTVVAGQSGSSLTPYDTKAGKPINLLAMGKKTKDKMFQRARMLSNLLTWTGRLFSVFMLFLGMVSAGIPLTIFGDRLVMVFGSKLTFLGMLVGAVLLTVFLSLMIIGLSWVSYQPLFGVPLIFVGLLAAGLLVKRRLSVPQTIVDDRQQWPSRDDSTGR